MLNVRNALDSKWLSQQSIIAYTLGFVVIWFGVNELLYPIEWIGFLPLFIGTGKLASALLAIHGVILVAAGLMLIFNFYRRLAALVLALTLAEIVIDLMLQSIPYDVIVRDIGLLGMAVALLCKPASK